MKLKKATFIVGLITICATSCVNKDNVQIRIEDSSSSQSTNEDNAQIRIEDSSSSQSTNEDNEQVRIEEQSSSQPTNKDNEQVRIEEQSSSQSTNGFKIYSNTYFSVEYPSNWQVVETPDRLSDVCIGYDVCTINKDKRRIEKRRIGLTVTHFPCKSSLKKANDEEKNRCINSEANIVSCTKTTVSGVPAYKNVSTVSLPSSPLKDIFYMLKANDELYKISFGTDSVLVDSNADVIEKIIASFRVK